MTVGFDALWAPKNGPASFPHVDRGLLTGKLCDACWNMGFHRCPAPNKMPADYANASGLENQRTPLCSYWETLFMSVTIYIRST